MLGFLTLVCCLARGALSEVPPTDSHAHSNTVVTQYYSKYLLLLGTYYSPLEL